MLSATVDNFLLSFQHHSIRDDFFEFMSKAFDITTPGYQQELTFLSLRIYQSLHGISINQTQHIYTNILLDWFKDNNCFKRHDHPIKAHPTYEYDIAQSQPLSPDELEHYEKKHNGPYKHIIGKLLHIQQWTRLDLNYAISRLAVYS